MEIKKQELKQILTGQRKDYERFADKQRREHERYIGALKEDFDSKVELIVEQYADIKKTLNSHSKMLESHTEMIVSMKEDIEVMKVDVSFIKSGLKQKVDAEEFGALERRVALLEAKSR